ncbi:MAG: nucleoside hydrolase [Blautia coccoides]
MQRTIRENPGEIVLVGISPMGNIARLFLLDSEIPSLLKGLYLMCGKFSEYDFKNWYREDDAGDGDFSAFEPHNIKSSWQEVHWK